MLAQQMKALRPLVVSVPDDNSRQELKQLLDSDSSDAAEILCGREGLEGVATHPDVETVVTGVVGFLGLKPTVSAIRAGKTIALANKETLVAAGSVIMPMVEQFGARIIPIDSEHSAIFQSIHGHGNKDIKRIWLTGSGGPFRTWSYEQIRNATVDDALQHPNWSMGRKITIDSATLMNKGLEIIEARWLFDLSPEHIRVVIHPQSILHSAVEFTDGSVVGQMGLPDMRLPIHYALFYPERVASDLVPQLDLTRIGTLTFEEPDLKRFPCLKLAAEVANKNDTSLSVLNAANEVAVEAFLKGHIKFHQIAQHIESVLEKHIPTSKPSLDDILDADGWARQEAQKLLKVHAV